MNSIFKSLGFTENETKVYLGFLKSEGKSAAQLSRILKLDKSSCYKAVDSLLQKGLLLRSGYSHGTTYTSANPEILKELHKSKELELKSQKDPLSDLVETLKESYESDRSTYLSIDKGIEGLKLRMTESLQSKEKLIRENFNHHPILENPEYIKFVKEYAKERVKKNIVLKELQSDSDRDLSTQVFKIIMTDTKKFKKEQRSLPKEFKDKNSFRIWDDTAIILSSDKKGEFIVLTIKDKYIVTLLKSLFDFLWLHSNPI